MNELHVTKIYRECDVIIVLYNGWLLFCKKKEILQLRTLSEFHCQSKKKRFIDICQCKRHWSKILICRVWRVDICYFAQSNDDDQHKNIKTLSNHLNLFCPYHILCTLILVHDGALSSCMSPTNRQCSFFPRSFNDLSIFF